MKAILFAKDISWDRKCLHLSWVKSAKSFDSFTEDEKEELRRLYEDNCIVLSAEDNLFTHCDEYDIYSKTHQFGLIRCDETDELFLYDNQGYDYFRYLVKVIDLPEDFII